MTQTALRARLYKFIVESRCVRITDLMGRFPEEFSATPVRRQRVCDSHVSSPPTSGEEMGRLSQGLSDALRFLLAEEVVLVNRRGHLVHVNAWKEKSQIHLERAWPVTREFRGN